MNNYIKPTVHASRFVQHGVAIAMSPLHVAVTLDLDAATDFAIALVTVINAVRRAELLTLPDMTVCDSCDQLISMGASSVQGGFCFQCYHEIIALHRDSTEAMPYDWLDV